MKRVLSCLLVLLLFSGCTSSTSTHNQTSSTVTVKKHKYKLKISFRGEFETLNGKYTGKLKNNKANGEDGEFKGKDEDGTNYYIKGDFKNGLLDGLAVVYDNDNDIQYSGTYTNGTFQPTNVDDLLFNVSALNEYGSFDVSDDTIDTLITNKKYFNENIFDTDLENMLEDELDPAYLFKSVNSYKTKFLRYTDCDIAQIYEDTLPSGHTLTSMLLMLNGTDDCFVVHYIGSIPKVEGDTVTFIGVPTDSQSFDNVSGGTTNYICFLAAQVQ